MKKIFITFFLHKKLHSLRPHFALANSLRPPFDLISFGCHSNQEVNFQYVIVNYSNRMVFRNGIVMNGCLKPQIRSVYLTKDLFQVIYPLLKISVNLLAPVKEKLVEFIWVLEEEPMSWQGESKSIFQLVKRMGFII